MKRMTENSRPVPGPAAARDASQGGGKGGSSRRRSRRRRGKPKGRAGQQHNNQNSQNGQQNPKQDHKQDPKQDSKQNSQQDHKNQKTQNHKKRRRRGGNPSRKPQQRKSQYSHDSNIETRDETSAGGLVVSGMAEAVGENGKVDMNRIYVALIGRLDRRGRLLWSMPKGHVENGEDQWVTAEREVWEETGIVGEAFDTLGVIDYWFVSDGVRIHKTVHHNLLRYVDGEFNDEDPEVTEVTWVPMSELMEHLAYADERKLARIACDRMPELARKEKEAGRATPR